MVFNSGFKGLKISVNIILINDTTLAIYSARRLWIIH